MTRRPLFLLLLLLGAFPGLAQEGDLSVRFSNTETRVSGPTYYTFHVHLRWTGGQPARNVVLELEIPGTISEVRPGGFQMQCTSARPLRCTISQLARTSQFGVVSVSVRLTEGGTYVAKAAVSTSTPEGPAENNSATHTLEVSDLPNLSGSVTFELSTIDPKAEGVARLNIASYGGLATNIVVRARVEDGGTILRAEVLGGRQSSPTCSVTAGEALCRIPSMGQQAFELVRLVFRTPDRREGGKVVVTATLESDREDYEPRNNSVRAELILRRLFVVSSSADAGSGTLRQTIEDAAANCEAAHCTIRFDGVAVIQPRTPLPQVRGIVRIDGGESRVLLDGSLLAEGHGLHYAGTCGMDIRNLEIRNFPRHGIEATQTANEQSPCTVGDRGLLVRRSTLSHNERGIVTKGRIDASLRENVIHDNRRAGIFIDGSYYSEIFNNVVVDNGAAGIFINTSAEAQFGGISPGADIVQNVVHGNGEWGIARTHNGLVQIRSNSTIRNGLYGIDLGLDLSTPNRENDVTGRPNKPLLESATYDPATNTTVIRGTAVWGSWIDLYASSSLSRYGYPESELYLGYTTVLQNGRIEFRVPADLRGLWITATKTTTQTLYFLRDDGAQPRADIGRPPTGYDTSELSDAVQVQ